MPTIKEGENKDSWMERCVPELVNKEGYDNDQAVAICESMWDEQMSAYRRLAKIMGFKPIKIKTVK